jgi:hypothetical protein
MKPDEFANTQTNAFEDGARSNPQRAAPSRKPGGFSPSMTNTFEDVGPSNPETSAFALIRRNLQKAVQLGINQ